MNPNGNPQTTFKANLEVSEDLEVSHDWRSTLRMLRKGMNDPSFHETDEHIERVLITPEGVASVRYAAISSGIVKITACGPGARQALIKAPDSLGIKDVEFEIPNHHKSIDALLRRIKPPRLPSTRDIWPELVMAVISQRVTGLEAHKTWKQLCKTFGVSICSGDGDKQLFSPPRPDLICGLSYYQLHQFGVERKRATTIVGLAQRISSIRSLENESHYVAKRSLRNYGGIGPWTIAEVSRVGFGDADAVSIGDFHLKNQIVFAFTGKPRGTDEEMLRLLEPYTPQRARVCMMIAAAGIRPPRFGPRYSPLNFTRS